MGYPVKPELITNNRATLVHKPVRPEDWLKPQGFVIHSTDDQGATAQNIRDYFQNHPEREASTHYVADWQDIINMIPENEIAWHAGPTANHMYLSVEMCEPRDDDPDRQGKFSKTWDRTVWLVAAACVRYGWSTGPNVWSHKGISARYPSETNHQDPYPFLAKYGKSWAELLAAIDAEINQLNAPASDVTVVEPPAQERPPAEHAGLHFSYPNNAKVVGDDLYIRDARGKRIKGHYVAKEDSITVLDVSYSRQLALVEYPTPAGVRRGYVRNMTSLIRYFHPGEWHNGSTPEPVLDEHGAKIGSLNPRESATPLYRSNGKLHVVYNTGKGANTKSGFVAYNGGFDQF